MFKGLSNLGSLLKQAQQLGSQMGQISEEMKKRRVVGTAGGGMVEIEVNGLMEVLRCHVDRQLAAQNDVEMLEDLIVAAVNQAIDKGKRMHADMVRDFTGGLPLPGITEALERFTGTGPADETKPTEKDEDER
jgi:nucleoid-associated protein EbfC